MARYRVGEEGLRVITPRGIYSLPPGAEIPEIPEHFEGKLEVVELDDLPKAVHGYADKVVRPESDK